MLTGSRQAGAMFITTKFERNLRPKNATNTEYRFMLIMHYALPTSLGSIKIRVNLFWPSTVKNYMSNAYWSCLDEAVVCPSQSGWHLFLHASRYNLLGYGRCPSEMSPRVEMGVSERPREVKVPGLVPGAVDHGLISLGEVNGNVVVRPTEDSLTFQMTSPSHLPM